MSACKKCGQPIVEGFASAGECHRCMSASELAAPPCSPAFDKDEGAAPCSAKITQRQLESILINEGIIQAAAIEDPEGYDGGRTELAMTIATQQINEIISPNGDISERGPLT